jgi:hypothetical protein
MISAISLIIGDATRNVKVTPSGTPALTNPRNSGTALQEQNGVIMPSNPASKCPKYRFFFDKMSRTFCGGRNERMIEMIKMITVKSKKIFIVSYTKKLTVLPIKVFSLILRNVYVIQSANSLITG